MVDSLKLSRTAKINGLRSFISRYRKATLVLLSWAICLEGTHLFTIAYITEPLMNAKRANAYIQLRTVMTGATIHVCGSPLFEGRELRASRN